MRTTILTTDHLIPLAHSLTFISSKHKILDWKLTSPLILTIRISFDIVYCKLTVDSCNLLVYIFANPSAARCKPSTESQKTKDLIMETLKKTIAVMLTIPLWAPILLHVVIHFLIIDTIKENKEFEE